MLGLAAKGGKKAHSCATGSERMPQIETDSRHSNIRSEVTSTLCSASRTTASALCRARMKRPDSTATVCRWIWESAHQYSSGSCTHLVLAHARWRRDEEPRDAIYNRRSALESLSREEECTEELVTCKC